MHAPSTQPSPTTVQLRLAGAPQAAMPDGTVHELGAPDALLLAWLALQGPTAREKLATLLWPTSSPEGARNALRQRLFRLKHQCGRDLVDGSRQLALAGDVRHDLDAAPGLLGAIAAPEGEMALWLHAERERRRAHRALALTERIESLVAAGEPTHALVVATELLDLDPLAESAHRQLMRLHYLGGDRAAALQAFDRCEQLLKHELGTRPSRETLALLQTLEGSETAAPPAPAARSLPAALMRPPRLIGRAAEQELLLHTWRGASRLVLIGEAGLGKSRLLQCLMGGTDGPLHAAARPGDNLAPYAALARALRELARRSPASIAPAWHAALAPVLPELSVGGRPGSAGPGRDGLLAALCRWLNDALPACGGIVLDDLHFADDATLQLLPDLLAGTEGMAWVLSMRPPLPGTVQQQMLDALAADARCDRMRLQPLAEAALAELVDSLGMPDIDGAAMAATLRERSGGNPLFALETLKQAWLQGRLGGALDALPHPASVGQLIDRSLASLSAPALLLARVAAIAGADFGIDLASHVLQQGALQLADAWSELEARQVLRGTAFAHDLVHECVLSGIPQVLARHTHATVAGWLEAHEGEPARLAAHWESAGQPERALPALRSAAERAQVALRVTERIAFLMRGADIAEAGGQVHDAFGFIDQAVEAHMNTVRQAAGQPLVDRLDRLARTPLQRVRATDRRAWYAANLAQWDDAIAAGRTALADIDLIDAQQATQDADAAERAELRTSITQRLGTSLAMVARFDEALPLLRSVQDWVAAHADTRTAVEFHGNLAAVLDNMGRPAEAAAHHLRVIESTRELGDHAFMVTALANHAVSLLDAGHAGAAQTQLDAAQQLLVRYGLRGSSAAFVATLLAQAARADGRYAGALRWCDEAEALLTQSNPGWLPVVTLQRAQVLLDLAQWARAGQLLATLDAAELRPRWRARRGLLLGRLRLALGDTAAAALALADAHEALPAGGWPETRLTLRIEQASMLEPAAADRALQLVAEAAQQTGLPGVALAARLRAAMRPPGKARARRLARELDNTDPALRPNGLARIECWLGPAQAWAAAGDAEAAARIARAGLAWLDSVSAQEVPDPWQQAFVARQAAAQQLTALAGGRPVTPA
ncbi:MAG: ATP-binding protein [Aquabacterium sp.]